MPVLVIVTPHRLIHFIRHVVQPTPSKGAGGFRQADRS